MLLRSLELQWKRHDWNFTSYFWTLAGLLVISFVMMTITWSMNNMSSQSNEKTSSAGMNTPGPFNFIIPWLPPMDLNHVDIRRSVASWDIKMNTLQLHSDSRLSFLASFYICHIVNFIFMTISSSRSCSVFLILIPPFGMSKDILFVNSKEILAFDTTS